MIMRKVKTVTKNGKFLYKEIYDDGKPSWINQTVTLVGKDMIQVKSKQGREYWVAKSDKVKTMKVNVGDIAVVGTFKDEWLVTDIIPYTKPIETKQDDGELKRQLKEFELLGGGY